MSLSGWLKSVAVLLVLAPAHATSGFDRSTLLGRALTARPTFDNYKLDSGLLENQIDSESLKNDLLGSELLSTTTVLTSNNNNIDLSLQLPEQFTLPINNRNSNQKHRFTSTGTTIAGVAGKDFVVLGADTRATNDRIVADNRAEKIHKLTNTIYACGAGTSADLQQVTRQCYFVHKLQSMQYQQYQVPVVTVVRWLQDYLYKQKGNIGVNLVIGGIDNSDNRAYLYAVHPHGSTDGPIAFTALGSGGMAAMGVLEQDYTVDITLEAAINLVKRAILSGINHDMGSGSQVDLCIITADDNVEYIRAAVPEVELDDNTDNQTVVKATSSQGVNGFGNTPFAIKSVRQIVSTTTPDDEHVDIDSLFN